MLQWCHSHGVPQVRLIQACTKYLHYSPGMSHLMNKSLNLSPTEAACSCVENSLFGCGSDGSKKR